MRAHGGVAAVFGVLQIAQQKMKGQAQAPDRGEDRNEPGAPNDRHIEGQCHPSDENKSSTPEHVGDAGVSLNEADAPEHQHGDQERYQGHDEGLEHSLASSTTRHTLAECFCILGG